MGRNARSVISLLDWIGAELARIADVRQAAELTRELEG